MKVYFMRLTVILLALSMLSCDKLMEADSDMKIKAEDHYSTIGEVYGAFIGLHASFRQVAEKTIILSGLKGDLLQPTQNAPEDYWRVFRYEAGAENSENNAKAYYDVVINCNDFLKRVITYNKEVAGEIPENIYKGMVSQAIAFKVWCLMTAGKLFGEAKFYDLVVSSDNEAGMYTLKLADLPDFLMAYMQGGEDGVDAFNTLDWAVLLGNTGTGWPGRNINAKALYGELCLWGGYYQEAIDRFISVLSPSKDLSLNLSVFGGGDWYKMFLNNIDQKEMISVFVYNANNRQENKLLDYFSNEYPYAYYFAPTQHAVDYFASEMRNENNSFRLGDLRGEGFTYEKSGNQLVVTKYNLGTSENEYASDHYIHLYRAGGIHLMLAEALCFLNNYDAALAVLDNGIAAKYYSNGAWLPPFENLFTAFSNSKNGIRSRVNLAPLDKAEVFKNCLTATDSLAAVSGRIADEVARELAFEGQRWFTLVRMARHLNDPDFLAERVSLKFGDNGGSYRALLNDENNWFIK